MGRSENGWTENRWSEHETFRCVHERLYGEPRPLELGQGGA